MTEILKLEAKGFKSFAKKVEIPFNKNFNVVLGPNGSGKSNIIDCLSFVLGKSSAKGMRAEKSANLIFNGGKKGKPASEAVVSIYFSNDKKEFPLKTKEVKITRIVKKSGNSIYKINDETRTRQQVVDLLSAAKIDPDGHSIVLQGDIVRFMEMKSDNRREIIEEISGISIYEEKKSKAMNELNRVQEKLNEADIILTEREKTLNDLKKDRDQAIKFKEIEKNISRNKATRLHLMIKEKEEKSQEIVQNHQKIKKQIEQIQNKINEYKKEIEEKKKEIELIEKELEKKGDKRQRELAKEIEELRTNVIKKNTRKDVVENEVRRVKEREKGLQNSINDAKNSINSLNEKKKRLLDEVKKIEIEEKGLDKKIKEFKEKHGIEDMEDFTLKISELDSKIDKKRQEFNDFSNEKQELLRKKDKLEYDLKNIKENLVKAEGMKKEDAEKMQKLKTAKAEFKEVTKSLSSALNESSVYSSQLASNREKLMDVKDEYAKLRARNIGIKESVAGDMALKKIASMKIPGVYGSVGELGKVSSKYSLALEVAAGSRIKSVVVNNDATGAKCIQILKENRSGVVTFLPLNKLKERVVGDDVKKLIHNPGVIGLAIDLVTYEPRFKNVFKYVFGPTLVVESMSIARRLGVGRARMVTLDGDLLEMSGAMVGGYRRKQGMSFKEKEVEIGLEKYEKEIEKFTEKVNLLEQKKTSNEENIIQLRERKAILDAQISSSEKEVSVTEDLKELQKRENECNQALGKISKNLNVCDKNIEELNKKIDELKLLKNNVKEKMGKLASSSLSSELDKLENKKQIIREEKIKHESDIRNIKQQKLLYENEIDKTNQIISNIKKELNEFLEELNELKTFLSEKNKILKEKEKEQRKFYSEYQHLFSKKSRLEKKILDKETQIIKNEERVRGVEERANDFSVRIAMINGELAGLKKEFEEFKDVSLRRGMNLDEINSEIKTSEQELRKMGNVNLRALEIYEKVREEYVALTEKYETLKLEKEDVLKMMYEIETKKKGIFMKTFKAINNNFKNIFTSLSTKGDALLIVENPDDPFEAGIDIQVRIVGNKFLDIKSLSGGEKTMAALAFIFAIQDFEPANFYVMDEVDAALDKKNSELLSGLIAKYAENAQYVVISHNDAIISEADTIFGVSMQDGVSKVVSLKI